MSGDDIKVLLFDLGNVLVDFDPDPAMKRIAGFCSKSPGEILNLLSSSGAVNSFEKGELSAPDFYKRVKEILGLNLGYDSFVSIWNEVFFFSSKNRSVYHIANKLKQNYRIALLSNTNILHYRYIDENFPVLGIFDKKFLSFEIGAIKPERLIYEKVINLLGVLPKDIFYIDDRPDLVKEASRLGINGFVFTGIKQLVRDLSSLKITLYFPPRQIP